MKNKQVKQMICDVHENSRSNVEFATFRKSLYAWHYPPCEGGWFIYHNKKNITNRRSIARFEMKLSEKQIAFTRMIADLVVFAYEQGYGLTYGDAYRAPSIHGEFGEKKSYSAANSVHKIRLAVDFNLWIKGNLIETSDHNAWGELHDYWESIGGAKRVPSDANHFSMEHWGCR